MWAFFSIYNKIFNNFFLNKIYKKLEKLKLLNQRFLCLGVLNFCGLKLEEWRQ